jgi:hypothetical protein
MNAGERLILSACGYAAGHRGTAPGLGRCTRGTRPAYRGAGSVGLHRRLPINAPGQAFLLAAQSLGPAKRPEKRRPESRAGAPCLQGELRRAFVAAAFGVVHDERSWVAGTFRRPRPGRGDKSPTRPGCPGLGDVSSPSPTRRGTRDQRSRRGCTYEWWAPSSWRMVRSRTPGRPAVSDTEGSRRCEGHTINAGGREELAGALASGSWRNGGSEAGRPGCSHGNDDALGYRTADRLGHRRDSQR